MSAPKTPHGWTVELLGLIGAVKFSNGPRTLIWCDGRWMVERVAHDGRPVATSAPGVPQASTVSEARRVGCEWLTEVEATAA